jgi:quercetin dioxygenase-like cupin family protein
MNNTELEKSVSHILIEIIEYVPNSVVSKTIIHKTTGNVTVTANDTGEDVAEKISPFDTFIQVVEGNVEIIIDGKSNFLKTGQAIIIPAHTSNAFKAKERFKMIATIIKSGYEDITI